MPPPCFSGAEAFCYGGPIYDPTCHVRRPCRAARDAGGILRYGRRAAPAPRDELFRPDSLQRACLLEQDGETAGYGLLSLKYSHEAGGLELWVEELYVRPAFRGRGLGHEFFAWLRGLSAAEHIRRIRLETEPENERAAALYARMGFSPLGYCQMFREEAT